MKTKLLFKFAAFLFRGGFPHELTYNSKITQICLKLPPASLLFVLTERVAAHVAQDGAADEDPNLLVSPCDQSL